MFMGAFSSTTDLFSLVNIVLFFLGVVFGYLLCSFLCNFFDKKPNYQTLLSSCYSLRLSTILSYHR